MINGSKSSDAEILPANYLAKFTNLPKQVRKLKAINNSAAFQSYDPILQRGLENLHFFLENTPRIFLTTHEYPDADGLGSQLALYYGLKKLNIPVEITNCDASPEKYCFFDPENILIGLPNDYQWPDLSQSGMVLLDTNNFTRTKRIFRESFGQLQRLFIVDHHTCEDFFLTNNLIYTKSSSTGELVYYALAYLGVGLDEKIAGALYTAILSDTGSFRYPNTTKFTHQIAAHLLEYTINPREMYANIFQNFRPGRVTLMGPVLQSLKLWSDNRLAELFISQSEMKQYRVQTEDTDNIVNLPLQYDGIRGCLLFREEPDGRIKVSMRSHGLIDVAEIAHHFHGGGHRNAAGTKVDTQAEMKNIREMFIQAIMNEKKIN